MIMLLKIQLRMRTDTQDKVAAVTEGNVGWQRKEIENGRPIIK